MDHDGSGASQNRHISHRLQTALSKATDTALAKILCLYHQLLKVSSHYTLKMLCVAILKVKYIKKKIHTFCV